ncbi:hypothetical protein, partial [uncultured Duncaniella sp.]|uniref:hypothetical protein n=1 Tax=uncultured Duncaniella sp. TaxID=2768039 RepID=UPI00265F1BC5
MHAPRAHEHRAVRLGGGVEHGVAVGGHLEKVVLYGPGDPCALSDAPVHGHDTEQPCGGADISQGIGEPLAEDTHRVHER